jgi:hypothetical protein
MKCDSDCARQRSISGEVGPEPMKAASSRVMAASSCWRVRPGAAVATIWKKPPISREFCDAAISVAMRWS